MKGYSCQFITHVGCCIKQKLRENIKVCVNVLPTSYRQVTETLPTVSQLSAHCRLTGSLYFGQNLSAVCWPTVGQQTADSRPTVSWQTTNCRPTDDQLSADCRPTVDWQSADRFFGELFFTITDWMTDWLNKWLNGRLADWLTEWLIDWLTDQLTGWLTDCLNAWLPAWWTSWPANWLTG